RGRRYPLGFCHEPWLCRSLAAKRASATATARAAETRSFARELPSRTAAAAFAIDPRFEKTVLTMRSRVPVTPPTLRHGSVPVNRSPALVANLPRCERRKRCGHAEDGLW